MTRVTSPDWSHEDHMKFGQSQGWWDEWDHVGPFKTITMRRCDFNERDTMAHVMVKADQFKSINEAKNAGWNKPITHGNHALKKRRVIIKVIA
jgi:hypothetical protein